MQRLMRSRRGSRDLALRRVTINRRPGGSALGNLDATHVSALASRLDHDNVSREITNPGFAYCRMGVLGHAGWPQASNSPHSLPRKFGHRTFSIQWPASRNLSCLQTNLRSMTGSPSGGNESWQGTKSHTPTVYVCWEIESVYVYY